MKKYFLYILSIILFISCSSKDTDLFGLSQEAWFSQIIKDIKDADLDAADEHFISFSSEHVASKLLETTMLILAQAHVDQEEYIMANFYLDEYIKKYGTRQSVEYAEFLKIKANYDSFSKPNRNQKLMKDNIIQTKNFLNKYPNSKYRPLVDTMLVKMELGEYYLNNNIYDLYQRTGKEESAKIYKEKLENSQFKEDEIIVPELPWYSAPFE